MVVEVTELSREMPDHAIEISDDAIEVSDDVSEDNGMDDSRASAGAPQPVKQRESLTPQHGTGRRPDFLAADDECVFLGGRFRGD